jgi:hypothetical protein
MNWRVELGERFEGPYGTAQHATVPDHPATSTTVATWFMDLPNQAPGDAWRNYLLTVVSLDVVPGMPPPRLRYPEAEYELLVAALAPDAGPHADDVETWALMEPVNLVEQFHGVSRQQATRIARTLAQACTKGILLAETKAFVELFDGSLPRMMLIGQIVAAWQRTLAQLVEHELTDGVHGARLN